MKKKVAVIGAGINGLMCAYFLSKKQKYEITVYDRGDIPNCNSASYGNHRLIHPWIKKTSEISNKAVVSLNLWKKVLTDININGFEETGVMVLTNKFNNKYNIDIKFISPKEISNFLPFIKFTDNKYNMLFPTFGILFAKEILYGLTKHLKAKGVIFKPNNTVSYIDFYKQCVYSSPKQNLYYDRIIIASGYETSNVIYHSNFINNQKIPTFHPKRCYVVYIKDKTVKSYAKMPAWASIDDNSDMWGMPPVRGIEMKLGHGNFTKHCNPQDDENIRIVSEKILAEYKNKFHTMKYTQISYAKYNHWAEIKTNKEKDYLEFNNNIIITSDNGCGFKFATYVANKLCNEF